MPDWIANPKIEYVLLVAAVLFGARFAFKRYRSKAAKSAAETAESLLIAVVLVFLVIRPFLIQAFFIPSGSMIPTLLVRDHILVNKFVYRFQEPRYGDIIVFRAPPAASPDEKDFIKRLIGKEGDTIEIKEAAVYRNGKPLEEGYVAEPPVYEMAPITVPEDSFFVMGDNRNNSQDSHAWGALARDRVIGKAMVRFWPLNRLGLLH